MPLDLVIPVRDKELGRLKNCINFILKNNNVGKIVVVDFGSKEPIELDYDVEVLRTKRIDYPIWNKAHALNIGIKNTTADYIACVDCDILLPPKFFENLEQNFQEGDIFIYSKKVKRIEYKENIDNFDDEERTARGWMEDPKYSAAVGGVQIFSRRWLFEIRGYPQVLNYWGGMDTYMVLMAQRDNLPILDLNITILHQDHEKTKENQLDDEDEIKRAYDIRLARTELINRLARERSFNVEWGENKNEN